MKVLTVNSSVNARSGRGEEGGSQSRQSAKLFLRSSELGLHPSPSFSLGGGRVHTRLRVRGWGVPIPTRGQTLWYSWYIFTLLGGSIRGGAEQTHNG